MAEQKQEQVTKKEAEDIAAAAWDAVVLARENFKRARDILVAAQKTRRLAVRATY